MEALPRSGEYPMFAGFREKTAGSGRLVAGGMVLAVTTLVIILAYPHIRRFLPGPAPQPMATRMGVAQLEATEGDVRIRRRNEISWEAAAKGVQLSEGDLIQTGRSAKAQVRYLSGLSILVPAESIFAFRGSELPPIREEAGPASGAAALAPRAANPVQKGEPPLAGSSRTAAQAQAEEQEKRRLTDTPPKLELQKIVRFGKSLELIGRVDPGTSLTVNDESVEVAGDGSFKHFTRPFTTRKAQLVLKAIDLAGRVRLLTTEATLVP